MQSLLTTLPKPPYDRSKAFLRQVQSLLTTDPKPPYDRPKTSLRQAQSLLTTGPKRLAKPVLHRLWFKAFLFNFQYLLVSLKVSSICLHLLPPLTITFIFVLFFPSITCFRKQFLRKPLQIQFVLYVGCLFPPSLYVMLFSFCTRRVNWPSPNDAKNILSSVQLSWKRRQKI